MSEPQPTFIVHHHFYRHDPLLIRKVEKIMSLVDDLNTKIDELTSDLDTMKTAVDVFIADSAANFKALQDALAANNPAAIQKAIDKITAAKSTLESETSSVTAADAADKLSTP